MLRALVRCAEAPHVPNVALPERPLASKYSTQPRRHLRYAHSGNQRGENSKAISHATVSAIASIISSALVRSTLRPPRPHLQRRNRRLLLPTRRTHLTRHYIVTSDYNVMHGRRHLHQRVRSPRRRHIVSTRRTLPVFLVPRVPLALWTSLPSHITMLPQNSEDYNVNVTEPF